MQTLLSQEFLSAFGDVKQALDAIYSDVCEMNSSVQNMAARLQATKTQTCHLIDQTTKLQGERYRIDIQIFM
jgi:hypothetical protein